MKRVGNIKKIDLKIPTIIMFIVAAVGFVCAGMYAYFGAGSYKAENSKVLTITDTDIILKRGKNIFNDRIRLADDIHITDESFCVGDSNTAFIGTFDGCGHTVYFDYQIGKATSTLFAAIGEDGVVKNTRFVFTDVAVEANSFLGVANINYGTIQDCIVEYNLQFNSKDGMFTPFVGVNCGVIKNIVTKGTFCYNPDLKSYEEKIETPTENEKAYEVQQSVELDSPEDKNGVSTGNHESKEAIFTGSKHSAQKNEDEKKIAFAGVCVYNYGTLENVLSTPHFIGFYCTSRDNYLAGKSENVSIASVCAFSSEANSPNFVTIKKGLVVICEKTLYTSDDIWLDKFENFESLIYDVTGSINKTIIENTYDFSNIVWEIDETALCLKLKIK